MERNPFSISFGKKPNQYIEREMIIDEITEEIESGENQCFMLTGVRGSGKTVTLTAIEQYFRKNKDVLVIDLNIERDMLTSLVAKLYDSGDDTSAGWGYVNASDPVGIVGEYLDKQAKLRR